MAGETKRFVQAFKEALKDVVNVRGMQELGQAAADMIRLRTRLGSGVSAPGEEKAPLKELKQSTKDERKALQKQGRLSNLTSPGKSNLTRSGQLLDSIAPKPGSAREGQVVVSPQGKRSDSGLTNEEVGGYVSKQGRAFNNLSRIETKRLSDTVSKALREAMKRKLTKG